MENLGPIGFKIPCELCICKPEIIKLNSEFSAQIGYIGTWDYKVYRP